MYKTTELFDTRHTLAGEYLEKYDRPFDVIGHIGDFVTEIAKRLGAEYQELSQGVFVHREANLSDKATVIAPTVICKGAVIRPGAYIRGSALIGEGAVIGNSTEVKSSIIFDGAQLPHYNYVGDSIIGYKAHMGAGCIASNLRLDKRPIIICDGAKKMPTGLIKMGVLLGDGSEVGCNSVLSPGTVIGRSCLIYPLSHVRGVIPEYTVMGRDGRMFRREDIQ